MEKPTNKDGIVDNFGAVDDTELHELDPLDYPTGGVDPWGDDVLGGDDDDGTDGDESDESEDLFP